MKLYRAAGLGNDLFVETGDYRSPRRGEFYLSGAIPEVYYASVDYGPNQQFCIMRKATKGETTCPCCNRELPVERGG